MRFSSLELNTYLEKIRDINEMPFELVAKLVTNLKVSIWTQEYEKVKQEADDVLDLAELTALNELANDYGIKPDDCPELVKLTENYDISQIVKKFEKHGKEEVLVKLLAYKSSYYVKLLQVSKPSCNSDQNKIIDKYIKYGEIMSRIQKAVEEIQTYNSKPSHVKQESKNDNEESSEESQYKKLVELVAAADAAEVPEEAYWLKHLKDRLISYEK